MKINKTIQNSYKIYQKHEIRFINESRIKKVKKVEKEIEIVN